MSSEPQEVLWIEWKDNEDWPEYIARALRDSKHGLVRGRYQLGMRVHRNDERWSPAMSTWRLQKIPRHWDYPTVEEVAKQMGFNGVQILSKGRNGFSNSWTFLAKRADSLEFISSEIETAGSDAHSEPVEVFAVKEARRRSPQNFKVRALQPERTVRFSFPDSPVAASTKFQEVEQNAMAVDQTGEHERLGKEEGKDDTSKRTGRETIGRSRSPVKKNAATYGSKAASTTSVGQVSSGFFHGGNVVTNSGQGDCLYLAVAQALSKLEGKSRSHRQLRAFTVATLRQKKETYEPRWLHIDDKGKETTMSFDEYIDQQGQVGSWGGSFEVEVLATSLKRRFWICDNQHAFLYNEDGEGPPVVLQYGNDHYQNIEGCDEHLLEQRRKRVAKDSSQAFRGGVPALVASLRLSDFASGGGTSKRPRSAPSAASQSCRLSDFASVKTVRAKQGKPADHKKFRCFKEDSHTWKCDKCETVLQATTRLQLSSKRRNHIYNRHRHEPRSSFHQIKKTYVPIQVMHKSKVEYVGWECGFCAGVLPAMEGEEWWLRASIKAHLASCVKAPKGATSYQNQLALNKRCGLSKPELKGARAHSLAWARNMRQKGLAGMREIQEKSVHQLVRIDSDSHKRAMFACATCTRHWRSLGQLKISHNDRSVPQQCNGGMREGLLICKKKCTFWQTLNKKWKAKMAAAWRLSPAERRALNAACANNKRLPTKRKSEWQRDLTADEDVEENPGPSISCVSVNIQGQDNTFSFLEVLKERKSRPHLVALQETNLDVVKRGVVIHKFNQMGYSAWATQPMTKVDAAGKRYHRGGVLLAVRQNIKAAWHAEFDEHGGQCLTVDAGTFLLSTCWRRPDHDEDAAADFWSHLTETRQDAQARALPWVAVGDWNNTPDQMWMCRTGSATLCAVTDEEGSFLPSRWHGRCVDFAISSFSGILHAPSFWEEVLSDHKVFEMCLDIGFNVAGGECVAPTRSYLKPTGVSTTAWRETIAHFWQHTDAIQTTTTEEEWYTFNAAVEECMRSAAATHGCRITETKRPKGTAPWTLPNSDYHCRGGTLSTFPIRSAIKLLGRIREYRRQLCQEQQDARLLRNIQRTWPESAHFHTWFQAEQHLQKQIDTMKASLKKTNMQQWRARMNRQGKAATKWLKAKPVLVPRSILRADGSKTQCPDEALHELSVFWRRTWDRPISAEVHRSLQEELSRPIEEGPHIQAVFPPAEALLARARQAADGAPGPDGWAGGEVEHWCLGIWETYLQLLHRWASRGQWPRSWQHMRQVHIRKDDCVYEGDAVPAKAMRPISVQSILVRIVGSAFVSQPEVREWVKSQVPRCCHGALAGRDVATAWSDLAEAIEQKQVIASLDFEKCFDNVWPSLALATMRRKGLSPVWCNLLGHIWQGQRRWLQLGRFTASSPDKVSCSLPQGDAMSPLALVFLLADTAAKVDAMENVSTSMFVDDRAICSFDARQVMAGIQVWEEASQALGLKENQGKTGIVCFTARQHRQLVEQGVRPETIKDQIRILGIDVVPHGGCEAATMAKRAQEGIAILTRLAFCPIGREVRRALYRSRVIPLLTWGAWLRPLPACVAKEVNSMYRSLSRGHSMGSKPLRTILEGHCADPAFWALHQSLQAAARAHRFRPLRWRDSPSSFGWQRALVKGLGDFGWSPVRPWVLEHPIEGRCRILEAGDALHKVRESWRRKLFHDFLQQDRRDSRSLRQVAQYDTFSCRLARTFYEESGNHVRSVLVGAALSTAVYHRIRKEVVPAFCKWCGQSVHADWEHLVWHCEFFRQTRPASIPQDFLTRRLGWPANGQNKAAAAVLLHHMALVRQHVLEGF